MSTPGQFPTVRLRRLRATPELRAMVRETSITPSQLIAPLFVTDGTSVSQPIQSMPGISRVSVDRVADAVRQLVDLGIQAVILFGVPDPARKDSLGKESYSATGAVQRAVQAIKASHIRVAVITDVCMCEYTSHGHCGILDANHFLLNDETLDAVRRIALSHAEAGADIVAPSGMIDGAVGAIRDALDDGAHKDVCIMAYAVKYASAFYGPFREAGGGAPTSGDRRSHQLDPANMGVAVREAKLDIDEGADFLMVKPALAYLDIMRAVHDANPGVPLVAYNVSGEYSMVKAAATAGWVDERAIVLETLTSMRRAGADLIITYHAADAARWLNE